MFEQARVASDCLGCNRGKGIEGSGMVIVGRIVHGHWPTEGARLRGQHQPRHSESNTCSVPLRDLHTAARLTNSGRPPTRRRPKSEGD